MKMGCCGQPLHLQCVVTQTDTAARSNSVAQCAFCRQQPLSSTKPTPQVEADESEQEEEEEEEEEEVVARCYVCLSYTTSLWLVCDHCGNIACNDCIFKESVPTGCARRDYCAKCVKFFSILGEIHESVVINPPIKKKHRCAAEKTSNRVCSVCDSIPCDRCFINNNTAGYCASCVKLGCDFYEDYQPTIDELLRK